MTVLLTELLPAEHIVVPLEAGSFRDAIGIIVKRLHGAGAIRNLPELERVLDNTRARDVVAISDDVALPHFRTEAVDHLVLGLGITGSLAMIGTWIALGGGPRKCEVTGIFSGEAADTVCRVAFGVGAFLTWVFTVVLGVVSYRRLRAAA